MAELLTGLASALVGGAIAGYFSLETIRRTFQHERQREAEQADKQEQGLLQALHDEMDVLWNRYNTFMGPKIENLPQNQPFLVYYPILQDYFTMYRANANKIGAIRDDELRHLIVTVYTQAMGMVDSFRMNNELVRKYEHYDTIFRSSGNVSDQQIAQGYLQPCIEYAAALKYGHAELKTSVATLLQRFRGKGISNKQS